MVEPGGFRSAIQTTVDSTTSNKYASYISALSEAEGSFTISLPEGSSGFGSAFQLVGSPTNLEDLVDWFVLNEFDPFVWDTSYFGAVNSSMKSRISSSFTEVTFYFDDTSILRVNNVDWNWVSSSFRFEYDYAEDENGDEMPLDPVDYDHDDWVNYRLGDYLDENGYSPFFPTGGSFLVSGTGKYKLKSCNRIIFECEVQEDQ